MTLVARIPRTRTTRPQRVPGGFTLLEAILAMSLMGLIIGIGLIFYFNAQDLLVLRVEVEDQPNPDDQPHEGHREDGLEEREAPRSSTPAGWLVPWDPDC